MSDELMHDPSQPPTEEGVAENIMRPSDLVQTVVRVNFIGPANIRSQRHVFSSRKGALDFMRSLEPDPKAVGSPKQAMFKRAKLLGIAPEHVNSHTVQSFIEETNEPSGPFVDRAEPQSGDLPDASDGNLGDTDDTDLSEYSADGDDDDGGDAVLRAAAGVHPASGASVPGGPALSNLKQFIASRPALPQRAPSVREDGGETEGS